MVKYARQVLSRLKGLKEYALPVLCIGALVVLTGVCSVPAQAAQQRAIEALPSYRNPVTGLIEDTGQNEELGQSMTESVVKRAAELLIDDEGSTFVTLHFALTDNFKNLTFTLLDAKGEASPDLVPFSIVSEDQSKHEEDIRLKLPDLKAMLRLSLYSLPMDREVIFYLTFAEEGAAQDAASATPAPTPTDADSNSNEGLTVYENAGKEATTTAIKGAARNQLLLFLGIAAGLIVVIAGGGFVLYHKKKQGSH